MISVIIPTYNSAHLLPRAVESVMEQAFPDVEIIVADDGSEDNTSETVRQLDAPIKYIRINHVGLPAVTRNAALKLAKGEYIAFLDADDAWFPGKLEKQLEIIQSAPNIGLVCTNAMQESEKGSRPYFPRGTIARRNTFRDLIIQNFVVTSSVLTKRSVLVEEGYFCENFLFRAIEDYHLWLRIALDRDIVFVDELLTLYRDMPRESIRGSQNMSHYWRGVFEMFRQFDTRKFDAPTARLMRIKKRNAQRELVSTLWKAKEHRKLALLLLGFRSRIKDNDIKC